MNDSLAPHNDRREVRAWTLYAWAFHSFVTTVATVLFGPYLTSLAQDAVGENGPVFLASWLHAVTAKSFFFYCLSLSVFLQVLLLPLLGAVADYTAFKKRLMAVACYVGAGSTCLLFFVGDGLDFRWGGALFGLANLSFGASSVLYNAFLPEIASPGERDRVSSRGYAMGYLGGALLLAANLVFMGWAPKLGITTGQAVRWSLLSAGVWWGGFAAVAFRRLQTRTPARPLPAGRSMLALGLSELRATFRELAGRPQTRRFLVAYLLFSDGIQTVSGVVAVFFAQELFVARGLVADESFLLGLMLMVQFVGFAGSLVFERIAAVVGAKRALILSLVGWCGVVIYGYGVLRTTRDAWAMSAVGAIVLGGSQALARSLFSRMIPAGREASFFALYEISSSGTSWIGPFLFGIVVAVTNSYRQALLSLIVLFVSGTLLLVSTDTEEAFREASGPSGSRRARRRPLAWVRSLLDTIVSGASRVLVHVFFREIDVTGIERIPRGVPLVLAATHTNSVVDGVLLLALPVPRLRLLAKSTLFSHPVMGPLLALVGALPVYRREDQGVDPAQNLETFARCHDALAAGNSIALFPEGTSHNHPHRLPLKAGAARIALEAELRRGPLGLRIVPVIFDYEVKGQFRSRVRVRIGEPIDPGADGLDYAATRRVAVGVLTERIAAGMEAAATVGAWSACARPPGRAAPLGEEPTLHHRDPPELASLSRPGVDRGLAFPDRRRTRDLQTPRRYARVSVRLGRRDHDRHPLWGSGLGSRHGRGGARERLRRAPHLGGGWPHQPDQLGINSRSRRWV